MNPTAPIPPVQVLRVPSQPGERKRREQDQGEAFRRALQQRGEGEAGTPAARPAAPAPRALQQRPSDSRRDGGSPAHHVDILA